MHTLSRCFIALAVLSLLVLGTESVRAQATDPSGMDPVQALAGVGNAVFALVEAVVGIRLLLLWRRTRQLPEFTVGMGLLLVGGLGFPLMVAGGLGRLSNGEISLLIVGLGVASIGLGVTALNVFTWKVFRPHQPWGAALSLGTLLAGGVICVGAVRSMSLGPAAEDPIVTATRWWIALRLLFQVWYIWTAIETLSEYARARRRLALGLSDPVVGNRMFLWGAMAVLGTLNNTVAVTLEWHGLSPMYDPSAALVLAANGLVMGAFMVLTFMPPRSYVRFISRRAAATGA